MEMEPQLKIGEAAQRAGLIVRTVPWYSDQGLGAECAQPRRLRPLQVEALAGLELIRTLQSVGLDLKTIRRVPGREVSLPEIASSDEELLPVQIRILGLRPAILRAVASQTTRAGGMDHHASVGEALGAGAGGKRRSLPEGGPQRSLRDALDLLVTSLRLCSTPRECHLPWMDTKQSGWGSCKTSGDQNGNTSLEGRR
jgi:DNA-binding transcriptional MerR regulator